MLQVALRPMHHAEAPFIRDSWTRSFVVGPPGEHFRVLKSGSAIAGWAWFDMHRAWVRELIEKPDTHVIVAAAPNDEAVGWVAFSAPGEHPLVLHYVYVLQAARRHGVATRLIAAAHALGDAREPKSSHLTDAGRHIERSMA